MAVDAIASLEPGSTVLDPMCGSGTVLHAAASNGFTSLGFDVDPLAVLITQVATSNLRGTSVLRAADRLVMAADRHRGTQPPWIAEDEETEQFVCYWFGSSQRRDLEALAIELSSLHGKTANALRVALSRTIITKDRGASLARDVSHSRPHKVAETSTYDVREGFLAASRRVATWLDANAASAQASVRLGDARRLPRRLDSAVDLVITSPPYLNAIDYLRGHRLSLVWLGHQIRPLRDVRASSVGTERMLSEPGPRVRRVASSAVKVSKLPDRERGMMYRYCTDLVRITDEVARVLRPGGEAVFVVGNSKLKGVFIANSEALKAAGRQSGLVVKAEVERVLPAQHRYLPPPTSLGSSLDKRMNTETVLRLRKAS